MQRPQPPGMHACALMCAAQYLQSALLCACSCPVSAGRGQAGARRPDRPHGIPSNGAHLKFYEVEAQSMHCFIITDAAASMIPPILPHCASNVACVTSLFLSHWKTQTSNACAAQGWFSHRRRKDKREKQEKEGAEKRVASAAGAPGAPAQAAASSQPRPAMLPPMAAMAQQAQHYPQMRPMLPQPGSAVSMRPPPAMQQAVPQGQQPPSTGAWLGPMTGPTMRPPGGVPAGLPPGVAQMQAAMTPQQAAAYNQQLMQQHQLRILQQQAFAAQQQQQQLQQQQRPPAQHQQQQQAQLPQPQQPPQSAVQAAQAPQRAPSAQPGPAAALSQGLQPPVPHLASSMPASGAHAAGPQTAMHAPVQSGGAAPAGHAAFQHAQHQQQMLHQQQQQAAYLQQQQQQQPRPYLPTSSLAPPQGPVAGQQQQPFSAVHAPNGGPAAQQMPPPSSTVALSQAQLLQRVQYFQAMQVRPCGFDASASSSSLLCRSTMPSCCVLLLLRRSPAAFPVRNIGWVNPCAVLGPAGSPAIGGHAAAARSNGSAAGLHLAGRGGRGAAVQAAAGDCGAAGGSQEAPAGAVPGRWAASGLRIRRHPGCVIDVCCTKPSSADEAHFLALFLLQLITRLSPGSQTLLPRSG